MRHITHKYIHCTNSGALVQKCFHPLLLESFFKQHALLSLSESKLSAALAPSKGPLGVFDWGDYFSVTTVILYDFFYSKTTIFRSTVHAWRHYIGLMLRGKNTSISERNVACRVLAAHQKIGLTVSVPCAFCPDCSTLTRITAASSPQMSCKGHYRSTGRWLRS